MKTTEVIGALVDRSASNYRALSLAMGRSATFLSTTKYKGSEPSLKLVAELAPLCGYKLALVPAIQDLPKGSEEITLE